MMAGLRHLVTTTTTNIPTTERDSTTLTTTETRQPTTGNIREISETTPVIAENILRISRTTLITIENIIKNIQSAQQQTKIIDGSTRRIMRGTILA